ncbi:MAG: hypothetical protein JJU03_10645 [Idiomarina sp.]|nr:hypothetical protein [Idiomarina sp.]
MWLCAALVVVAQLWWIPASAQDNILVFTDVDPTSPDERQTSATDIGGQLLEFYLPYLDDFNIRQSFVNSSRAISMIQQRGDACRGKTVYTEERAQTVAYTNNAHVVFPPLRLYMLASNKHAETFLELLAASEDGFLSLAEVLELDADLTLGLMRGRSYTPGLDQAIANDQHSNQLWIRAVADQSSGLFDMLVNERIDLTIHTSVAVKRFTELRNIDPELLVIPLREAREPLLGYFMCSRNDLGQRFLSAVDTAVNELAHTRAYFDAHMSWVTEVERPFYAALYNQQFGTNFEL